VQEVSFSITFEEKCPIKISKWLYYLNLISICKQNIYIYRVMLLT